MIAPLTYSPPRGPLAEVRPTVALGFLLVPAAIAMAFSNPVVLAGCAASVLVAARGSGALAQVRRMAPGALLLGILIVGVNALVVRRGDTVLFRGPDPPLLGPIDVTAEALAEGGVIAGRVAIVIAAFAIVSARVDPDYLLRSLRRFAGRSAMTATLLIRLVPLAMADLTRLREAAELRGPGASPVTRTAILRRLVSGTMDRAVDSAAALEVRGYGRPATRFVPRRRRGRLDGRFAAGALVMLGVATACLLGGAGGFDSYPTITVDLGPATFGLAVAVVAITAATLRSRTGATSQ